MSWIPRPPRTVAFSGANSNARALPKLNVHWVTECHECGAFLDIVQRERPTICPECGADISKDWHELADK